MLKALLMMLVLGGLVGLVLGFASKAFHVEPDHREEELLAMLPGYNCGGCGNPGCSGMAEKLVSGESKVEQCRPCKPDMKAKISEYLAANQSA